MAQARARGSTRRTAATKATGGFVVKKQEISMRKNRDRKMVAAMAGRVGKLEEAVDFLAVNSEMRRKRISNIEQGTRNFEVKGGHAAKNGSPLRLRITAADRPGKSNSGAWWLAAGLAVCAAALVWGMTAMAFDDSLRAAQKHNAELDASLAMIGTRLREARVSACEAQEALERIMNTEHGTRNNEVKRGGQPPQSPLVGRKSATPSLANSQIEN
jgi:hypothetical protein